MRIVVIAVGLLLVLPLAGCLDEGDLEVDGDGENPNGDDGPDGGSSAATGTIRGEVADTSFEPLAEAKVELMQDGESLDEVQTLDNGSYEFKGLEPGEYRLRVSASCCKGLVRGALVKPGEVTKITIQLEEHRPVEGFMVRDAWDGFIGCSAVLPVTGVLFNPQGACAENDPNNDPVRDFKLEPGLKTVVVGMEWDEETTNPLGDLQIYMTQGTGFGSSTRFFTLEGPSPLEIVMGPEDPEGSEDLYFENIDEEWSVQFTVTGSTQGSIVYQQPFTVYYDLYYNDPAPDGASAFPE